MSKQRIDCVNCVGGIDEPKPGCRHGQRAMSTTRFEVVEL